MSFEHLLVLLVVCLGLSGCGGAGEETVALEMAFPDVSDIDDLESAERVELIRRDSSSSLSYRGSGVHLQKFEPKAGYSLEDVVSELVERLEASGWTERGTSATLDSDRRWSGTKTTASGLLYTAVVDARLTEVDEDGIRSEANVALVLT